MDTYELGAETLWVFVSCSHEVRHLDDIIYGVDVLRARGVGTSNVLVFVDHPTPEAHLHPYGITNVFSVSALGSELAKAGPHTGVVAIVTGHGSELGLGDGSHVRPAGLCAAVRSVPGAQICVLLMSQCFAGIFNFVDCYGKPPLIVIGATNLNLSVSLPLQLATPINQLGGAPGLSSWLANLFAFYFLAWIRSPVDIDGDGELTLLDAYRYAGAASNGQLRKFKALLFRQAHAQERMLERAEADLNTLNAQLATADEQTQQSQQMVLAVLGLKIKALQTALQNTLETLYLHQEPWLLNANVARVVRFPVPSSSS